MSESRTIRLTLNGETAEADVECRRTLADFLRDDLNLTGTHLGCEHGVCGACTVLFDGDPVRACLLLAVQADGHEVTTVEGVADSDGLHPIQDAFWTSHSFQCGFCTAGIVMTTWAFLAENPDPTDDEIRDALGGNLCRCTGYQSIVDGVRLAAQELAAARSSSTE
jgi:aerobic-type carbon monoxide dehydrogenase small subunit (CoxS/CutS family)